MEPRVVSPAMRPLLAIALLAQPALPAQALDPARPLAEFTLETWGRDQGLLHGFVIDLAQSPDG
jgi:hypothetical protein